MGSYRVTGTKTAAPTCKAAALAPNPGTTAAPSPAMIVLTTSFEARPPTI